MSTGNIETTLKTLGNAVELATSVVQDVVGNDIADSLNGTPLTNVLIADVVESRFTAELAKYLG